jgi:hypothetical protein
MLVDVQIGTDGGGREKLEKQWHWQGTRPRIAVDTQKG